MDIFAKLQGAHDAPEDLVFKRDQGQYRAKAREILWCCKHGIVSTPENDFIQLVCREFEANPRKDWAAQIETFYVVNHVAKLYWSADKDAVADVVDTLKTLDEDLDRDYVPHEIEVAINPGERREWVLGARNVYWKWRRTWYWLGYLAIQNDTARVWATEDGWDIKRVDLDQIAANTRLAWTPQVQVTRDGARSGQAQYSFVMFITARRR